MRRSDSSHLLCGLGSSCTRGGSCQGTALFFRHPPGGTLWAGHFRPHLFRYLKYLNGIDVKGYLKKTRVMFEKMDLQYDLDELEKIVSPMSKRARRFSMHCIRAVVNIVKKQEHQSAWKD